MGALSPISRGLDPDHDIIPRLQAGDDRALALLMDRHLKTIHGLAQHMLGDAFMAEDIAQTVFLRTWTMIPTWEPGQAKLLTWMCRVAKNLCLDQLRKKKPIYSDQVPDVLDEAAQPFEDLAAQDRSDFMQAALAQLPDRQRLALTLSYYQGLSQKDGADIMEIGVSAYESLLARARRALRDTLSADAQTDYHRGALS